ncbi:orotidine-5'-phosphate decarboxylase [Candidatus Albibeggiatoa sp. nov. NOAA]|uniref:orotidine-5'-phosphate decarboxylase n=1 Tax=Candidatus Albibeggiatoa sp. nov. NOAA TaxID=3162724 RepID=UPI00334296AC
MNNMRSPLIIALDFAQPEQALALAQQLGSERCYVKVGKELFTRSGASFVAQLVDLGFKVFLDLKYHDIPNTVAKACQAAADLGVWMVNVHALGGRDMLMAARDSLEGYSQRPLLIAVTLLTSLGEEDLSGMGLHGTLQDNVLRLARLSKAAGLDGLVCSPQEIQLIRQNVDENLVLVTPGIRPAFSVKDDQKRTMTPKQALEAGASYLVVGRPVIAAPDPLQALRNIEAEIA